MDLELPSAFKESFHDFSFQFFLALLQRENGLPMRFHRVG